MPQPAPHAAPAAAHRLESIDLLRGLVMALMVIDHARDYVHFPAIHGIDPTNLAVTTPAIFLTRWITHLCAPAFSFLAGLGVFLSAERGRSKRELSWFLVTRGLWLILLEVTVCFWGWNFSWSPHFNWGLVFWALGWSMIALAALIHLPRWAVAAFSVALIAGHNLLDGVRPEHFGSFAPLWNFIHVQGVVKLGSQFTFLVAYPLVPWIAVMSAGYAFGPVMKLAMPERRAWLSRLGWGAVAAFVALRLINAYGDPFPWSTQPRDGFTLLSFLRTTKYPPSLLYLLMTLGPCLLLLRLGDGGTPRALRALVVFGRVPLFFFLLHIPLVHGVARALLYWQNGRADFLGIAGAKPPPDAGFGLIGLYLFWAAMLVLLYPACRWFAALKARSSARWLSYL